MSIFILNLNLKHLYQERRSIYTIKQSKQYDTMFWIQIYISAIYEILQTQLSKSLSSKSLLFFPKLHLEKKRTPNNKNVYVFNKLYLIIFKFLPTLFENKIRTRNYRRSMEITKQVSNYLISKRRKLSKKKKDSCAHSNSIFPLPRIHTKTYHPRSRIVVRRSVSNNINPSFVPSFKRSPLRIARPRCSTTGTVEFL